MCVRNVGLDVVLCHCKCVWCVRTRTYFLGTISHSDSILVLWSVLPVKPLGILIAVTNMIRMLQQSLTLEYILESVLHCPYLPDIFPRRTLERNSALCLFLFYRVYRCK